MSKSNTSLQLIKKSKMKKILLSISIFTLCSLQTIAQLKKGAFISLNIGYNAAAAVSNPFGLSNINQVSSGSYDETQVNYSFGKGVNTGLNIGCMINEHIGFEIGVNYLQGSKIKAKEVYSNGGFQNYDITSKMIQIKPTMILATTMKKFTPYAKFGVTFGTGKVTLNNNYENGSYSYTRSSQQNKGIAVGFNAGIGILFSINKNISFSTELASTSMQYSPKKGTLTKSINNGVDNLASLSVYSKETDFVNKITNIPLGGSPDLTKPRQELATALPFSSVGINIGIKYSF